LNVFGGLRVAMLIGLLAVGRGPPSPFDNPLPSPITLYCRLQLLT
jgi:hypothetical protein